MPFPFHKAFSAVVAQHLQPGQQIQDFTRFNDSSHGLFLTCRGEKYTA
jgi:hypothetical protein